MDNSSERWMIGLELAAILVWLFARSILEAILSAGATDVAQQAAGLRMWAGIAAWFIAIIGWHGNRDERTAPLNSRGDARRAGDE